MKQQLPRLCRRGRLSVWQMRRLLLYLWLSLLAPLWRVAPFSGRLRLPSRVMLSRLR